MGLKQAKPDLRERRRHALPPRAWALAFGLAVVAGPAAAQQSTLTSSLVCKGQPSFVLCVLPMQPVGAHTITWADATIEGAPPFTRPVSGYSSFKDDGRNRPNLRFGLVPKGPGQGILSVRLRASVCAHGGWCEHVNRVLKAPVVVPAR